MHALTRIRLRTFLWFLVFPGFFLGIAPSWLRHQLEGPFRWEGTAGQWLGAWLLLNGAGLAGWCAHLFNVRGRGTPLPLDPPTQFVSEGPYRVVRNPMAIGLFLVLGGQALLYQSKIVALYLLTVAALVHAFVVLVEEPDLKHRFGEPYLAYRRQVPRWLPRPLPRRSIPPPRP
jgi:protein-S-isoprenylcysteine O-methyltransferase Ste14